MHHTTKRDIADALLGVIDAIDKAAHAADEQNVVDAYAALMDGMVEVRGKLTALLIAENDRALLAVAG